MKAQRYFSETRLATDTVYFFSLVTGSGCELTLAVKDCSRAMVSITGFGYILLSQARIEGPILALANEDQKNQRQKMWLQIN